MVASDSLFKLIKSLDRNEKRYFKLFVSKYNYKRENNYLLLFEAVDQQKEYDEKRLKKNDAPFIKNLAVEKNYLFQLILRSLNVYHAENSVSSQLKEMIRSAEILYSKSLYKEYQKILLKAKNIAYKYEEYFHLLEIIALERKLINSNIVPGDLEETTQEENKVIHSITTLYKYRDLYSKIRDVAQQSIIRNPASIKKIKHLLNHPLYKKEPAAISISTQRIYYKSLWEYYRVIGDLEKNYSSSKKLVASFEDYPWWIEKLPSSYASAIINLIISQAETNQYQEALETLHKLKLLAEKDPTSNEVSVYYGLSLNIYLLQGEFLKAKSLLPETIKWLEKNAASLNKATLITMYFVIANIYFGLNDFRSSIRWLQNIINFPEKTFREDLQCFGRIFQLVLHYKLDNWDVIPRLIQPTFRFISKKKHLLGIEIAVLKFLKKNRKGFVNERKIIDAFKILHAELLKITEDPDERKALEYFDMVSWLQSEIENRSFAEVVKEKVQKK